MDGRNFLLSSGRKVDFVFIVNAKLLRLDFYEDGRQEYMSLYYINV